MKFFSTALVVALICAVAVSAAPRTDESSILGLISEDESYGPITFGIIESITKTVEEFFKLVKCGLNVIGEVVKETDFKSDYEKFKNAVEAVFKNDVQTCMKSDGFKAKVQCTFGVIKKVVKLFGDFMKNVEKTNEDLAKKITQAMKAKCFKKVEAEEFAFALDDDLIAPYGIFDEIKKKIDALVKYVKCASEVVEKVVAGTDFKKDYDAFKAVVDGIIKTDAKKCNEMKGIKDKVVCGLDVAKKLFSAFADFTKSVEKTNKDMAEKIVKEVKSKCMKP